MNTQKASVLLVQISYMYDSYEPAALYRVFVAKTKESALAELQAHFVLHDSKTPLTIKNIEYALENKIDSLTLEPISAEVKAENKDYELMFLDISWIDAI